MQRSVRRFVRYEHRGAVSYGILEAVDVVQGAGVRVFVSDAWNFCEEIGKPPTP